MAHKKCMHSNITNKNIFSCGRDLEAIPWFISHEKKNVLKKYKYAHNLKKTLAMSLRYSVY